MRTEDALFLFLAVIVGIPLGLWLFQDEILWFIQLVDLAILRAYAWISAGAIVPVVGRVLEAIGGFYGRWAGAYGGLEAYQLKFEHTWLAGTQAWRPIVIVMMAPMMINWGLQARKKRRAQAFNNMTKGFLDKHLKSAQTVKGSSRQQWTVRRWFHNYKLNAIEWGTARWHRRINEAFAQQLGKPITDDKASKLVDEFAQFMHQEIVRQFGKKNAGILPPSLMANEAKASHAYVSTAIVRILAAARDQYGVLSPNRFRNRLFQSPSTVPIWFALNGFGRQTTHIESLAVLSHFYEEISKGEPIREPQLDNAHKGLDLYRDHHTDKRKLSDLDESEKIRKAEEKKQRANQPARAEPSADERYNRAEQVIS